MNGKKQFFYIFCFQQNIPLQLGLEQQQEICLVLKRLVSFIFCGGPTAESFLEFYWSSLNEISVEVMIRPITLWDLIKIKMGVNRAFFFLNNNRNLQDGIKLNWVFDCQLYCVKTEKKKTWNYSLNTQSQLHFRVQCYKSTKK